MPQPTSTSPIYERPSRGTSPILVFDDYVWGELGEDALLRPGVAIDAFLTLVDAKHELLFADDQVGLRKVAYPTSGT
jgi:hypothetical protein